jgi:2-polyprenyl-3-methyl-5-hydroxy-6-metoxy-1,4-benzoquinol methylase
MGEYLIKRKRCQVTGVEKDEEAAKRARLRGLKVIKGDIEDEESLGILAEEPKFDLILASSVIEHLKNPWFALIKWKQFLKKDGFLVVSTPNIAHWTARLKIFLGKFDYEDFGIFDNTHLRFFTIKTFQNLLKFSGYEIELLGIDPVGGGYPRISQILVHFLPGLFAYQILIKAKLGK